MSKFDYPRLPRHDIVVVLAESQIAAVSEADLHRPDPDFICKLYSHILIYMDILKDDEEQMEFEALEHLENPEHHMHSVRIMNLFVKLRQLLAAIRCPKSFTPKDLIKPDPDRTECFLGALLNFHLHRHAKMEQLKPVFDDLEHFEQQKLAAEARILQLKAEIAELEELREKELPLVQEVSFKIKELHQTVDELNKHQATLRTTIKQLKEKGKETDEKISNAEFALVQSVQENASLRSKIVQSPDKLQRALEEKKLALAEAKDAERAATQSFQDKTAKLEAYAKACKKISKHFSQMQAVQEQVSSAKSVEKDVKVLKSKLSDEDVLVKSLEARLVELQSKADQLKDFKRQLEKEKAARQEEADKEVNNVESEVESKRRALELRQKQVESVVAESDTINLKRKNTREEADTKIRELGLKSEEILSEFEKYSKSISNLLASSGQEHEAIRGMS
ncbi:kinetochore protein NUF2 homolog isoform X2 [Salvia miltiorrhiza]|uniref:kinetochore protein NUF2 homolog isoform X2 n=1 Tax=Salvia miltiorrhiza TaxID=226208 RepID=UPI0025AD2EC2|nr:kinetochore protein NUF2 homolog isoform X2 [Salvia miltiorrhiza]